MCSIRIFFVYFSCLSISQAKLTFIEFASRNAIASEGEVDENVCSGSDALKSEVITLLNFIADNYLRECVNVILYDKSYEPTDSKLNFDLHKMLREFPANFINAQIPGSRKISRSMLEPVENECRNYILLLQDVTWTVALLGPQRFSKVVVVTISSKWKIEDYLEGRRARDILNLLIVSYNWKRNVLFNVEDADDKITDINLYTHNLYTDGLGSSSTRLLTSWRCGNLARDVNLFPRKMTHGFNGRQFLIAASEHPPFTFKKKSSDLNDLNSSYLWDGVEIRLLRLLSHFLNYTIEIKEAEVLEKQTNGPSENVIAEVMSGRAEIGCAGVYITNERISQIMPSTPHTTDCAAFVTKVSTALPGSRAILGPFQWTVWVALTMTYMSAVIPLTFADSHSLKPLWENPWMIENMFWYVFGTFTNCFTFAGKNSWAKTKKSASRLFIGWYWAFTIIVTACYTGSIVSFITLFVFPDTIDHVDQLVKKNFRIGTLSTSGWAQWFNNSDHKKTKWLLRDMELVPNATQGLKNVSKSFYLPMFRPYAFLAGRAEMEYLVRTNYTNSKKKEMLHITKDCFVPFGVAYVFPLTAAYADVFNEYILRVQQSGLMTKLLNEFKWETERSASGKLLQASTGLALREITPHQRKLTLDDTEGMYLLMGIGYLFSLAVLVAESIYYARGHGKIVSYRERLSAFQFWKGQRFLWLSECLSRALMHVIQLFKNGEELSDYGSGHSIFKKYGSQISNIQPAARSKSEEKRGSVYFSEMPLSRKINFTCLIESRSLPNINQESTAADDFQNNVRVGGDGEPKVNRRLDLDIVFGSINSLPWAVKNVVHRRYSKNVERVQSY